MPKIEKEKNTQYLEGSLKLFFTNKMSIPLEISGNIKKTEFKVFYYDQVYNKIEEKKANVYIYKHQYKNNKSFNLEYNFLMLKIIN